MSVIYMTVIMSIGAMGVGYAAWSDGLTMEMTMTTGNLFTTFNVKEENLDLDNSKELNMKVDDENTLMISGEIYSTFEDDLPIVIENQGTIPAKLSKMNIVNDGEISNLQNKTVSKNRFATLSNFSMNNSEIYTDTVIDPDDKAEPFDLNISAIEIEKDSENTEDILGSYSVKTNKLDSLDFDGGDIGRLRSRIRQLEEEIRDLEDEIREYEKEEDFDFEYNLTFEQDL